MSSSLIVHQVDVSAHADSVTAMLWALFGLAIAFLLLRPELVRRLLFVRLDPRPAGLMRIAFGLVLIWAWCELWPLARELFTDEGMWLTEQARASERTLSYLWDPVEGFEHPWHLLEVLWGSFTVLHLRSDPAFVTVIWCAMLVALCLMTIGFWTRASTVVAWLLMSQLYGYSSVFFSSADFAIRTMFFLAIFLRWGEAYSIDSWRRRRRAIEAGAAYLPAFRHIPAWPQRLMMLQLAVIYCATGVLKSGNTWKNGTALYYALNLDHFYRVPMMGAVAFLQRIGFLPLSTWIVHAWEVGFPLVLVGLVLRTWERERAAGTWPTAPRWRKVASWIAGATCWGILAWIAGLAAFYYWLPRPAPFGVSREGLVPLFSVAVALAPIVAGGIYVAFRRSWPVLWDRISPWLLGRRTWLGLGVAMHVGIALTMNVGSFSQVMLLTYLPWLTGADVDRLWRFVFSKPCRPGEAPRQARASVWSRWLCAPLDRLAFRRPGPVYCVRYEATEAGVRRAALLRLWDLGHRLRFEPAPTPAVGLEVAVEGRGTSRGREAAGTLIRIFPFLWWLAPARAIPGLSGLAGSLAARILRQV